MNKRKYIYSFFAIILIALTIVSCTGKNQEHSPQHEQETEKEILYYTCGMHPSIKVNPAEYKKGSTQCPICHMDLVPVYREKETKKEDRKILYYTDGMHPSVRVSPEEYEKGMTQCPICHMDLVPVYEEKKVTKDAEELQTVKLTQREVLLSGIETAEVKRLHLFKDIRTVGIVAYDPKLRSAEQEYIQALNTYEKISESRYEDAKKRAEEILDAAEIKLELLGLSKDWIDELKKERTPHKSLILPSERMWVYADIYDFESVWPKTNDRVEVTSQADPSIVFKGTIKAIDPVINDKTRTMKIKVLVENKDNILKPNMYVDVYLKSNRRMALAIPNDAVLDTGMRKIVYVDLGAGKYALREVKIGPQATAIIHGNRKKYYPVVEGVSKGEEVVTKANFLIDSQSQLTGPAAAAYGGALDEEEGKEEMVPGHMH
jgi:uncharacterized Zn finger protein (UPF0148 family)